MNIDKLRADEDEAIRLTDLWSRSFRLLIYEILNRRHACTMDQIEHRRHEAWKKENNE